MAPGRHPADASRRALFPLLTFGALIVRSRLTAFALFVTSFSAGERLSVQQAILFALSWGSYPEPFNFLKCRLHNGLGEDHDCADDERALLRAYSELEQRPYRRAEVWLRDRRIASLGAVETSPAAANSSAEGCWRADHSASGNRGDFEGALG